MCCAAIIAFFCPPLAVLIMDGCGADFCINLLLTLLFFIPGLIHAFFVICRDERPQIQHTTVIVA